MKVKLEEVKPYQTKDGSLIRELVHPKTLGSRNLSLAEATVFPGEKTHLHRHHLSEEIYYVLEGEGIMTLGEEEFRLAPGDCVLIPPGTPHRLKNPGKRPLRILCACAPPYAHEDTTILEET